MTDVEKENIIRFQQIQQQLQVLLMQKQNVQVQQSEIEHALREIEKSGKEDGVFEVIGNIMIKQDRKDITESLTQKKKLLELRVSTIDKQLEKFQKPAVELQKELSKKLK